MALERNTSAMPPETVAFEPVDPREAAFQKLFDVHSLKVLASHGQDTFENLYKGSRGDPEYAADYKAALESEKFQATLKQYERMDVGEFMSTYSPMSSREAEALHSIYNKDAIAFSNDPSINDYIIERLQQIANGQDALDPDAGLTDEEKNQKKLNEALFEAFQDAHEERMEEQRKELSQQDRDLLSNQHIKTADGRTLSVLDIVDSLDRMLNNWDDTFNEMVDQGIADPKDKNKLYKNMLRYRNMMADPNLSEAEKQRQREQMIRDGLLTPEQMKYADKKAEQEQQRRRTSLTQENAERAASTNSETSVEMGGEDFEKDVVVSKNNPQVPAFTMSAESGIRSPVNMTVSFNSTATTTTEDPFKQDDSPTPVVQRNVATATMSPDSAFG